MKVCYVCVNVSNDKDICSFANSKVSTEKLEV